MSKKILRLDSHALSAYKRCPQLYDYTQILKIEPRKKYNSFDRGTTIAEMLQDYYSIKTEKGEVVKEDLRDIIDRRLLPSSLSDEDKELIGSRFLYYHRNYRAESWIPLAVEKGFSILLYEDEEYIFIYEGRPDLVIKLSPTEQSIVIVDNKSQQREGSIYPYNDQAMGYCYALRTNTFIYNYFGLQTTGDPRKWFHRGSIRFSPEILEEWRKTTIRWFKQIAETTDFKKSWLCEGKYGVCFFKDLCEQTEGWVIADKMRREFKANTHTAW